MKWQIPAKTFLLGEYIALLGGPALLLTTQPCFEITVTSENKTLEGIHPQSPAGLLWTKHHSPFGLHWHDPYHGRGGVGASTAQFLGTYLALHARSSTSTTTLLNEYHAVAWQGHGAKPSGYDLLAQTQAQCVYIHHKQKQLLSYAWPFKDISFLLIHSGQKLATHQYLQRLKLYNNMNCLAQIVALAQEAFILQDDQRLIDAINQYQEKLVRLDLQASHARARIKEFQQHKEILAAKGCGALGADVFLLILPRNVLTTLSNDLINQGWFILATEESLFNGLPVCSLNE